MEVLRAASSQENFVHQELEILPHPLERQRPPSGGLLRLASRMENHKIKRVRDILAQIRDTSVLVNSPHESSVVKGAMAAMDELTLEDVGLSKRRVAGADYSQCFELFSSESFQFAVFIVPAGQKLHLHDHPNMAVLSKILIGKLSVKSYDAIKLDEVYHTGDVPVAAPTIKVYECPASPWCLSAVHNNFHEFEAISDTVVFEALLPPYGDEERVCNYYEAYESPLVPNGFFLRIVDPPEDGPVGIDI